MFSFNSKNGDFQNRLLARLAPKELARLDSVLQPTELEQGQVLYDPGTPLEHVYFVEQGMISVVSTMEDGDTIEVATIGNEGLAGLAAVLGANRVSHRHRVQVAGTARQMSVLALATALKLDGDLRRILFRYHATFLAHLMQGVACNGLHSVGQRCCRWLLTTRDRVGSQELNLTHEFLAQMLGVRRASVSEVLRPFQEQGLIRASRGKITILDPEALSAASCECYHLIRGEYQWLMG